MTPADTYAAIREALTALGDRNSQFLTPEEAKGLGAVRAGRATGLLVLHPEAIVAQVTPESPAQQAGVLVGDRILAVEGVDLAAESGGRFARLFGNGLRADGSTAPLALSVQTGKDGPRTVRVDLAAFDANPPTGSRLDGDVGYLELPGLGAGPLAKTYADIAQDLIKTIDSVPVRGWILDLRRNTGGNVWPILAGIGPIVGEGVLGAYVSANGRTEWSYAEGAAMIGGQAAASVTSPYEPAAPLPPVAVLTSGLTANAGEAVVVAFRGRERSRTFGAPTRGVPTANTQMRHDDGALLVVTIMLYVDRTGRTYDGSIAPDVPVATDWTKFGAADDPVIVAAKRWLAEQPKANSR
ncbi:MAG: S41 family peptidase [Planctomycetota bacterium]